MKYLRWTTVFLTASVVLLACLSSQAARVRDGAASAKYRALAYSVPSEQRVQPLPAGQRRVPLGTPTYHDAYLSPGITVGYTWHDLQHYGAMGRMIETGPHFSETGPTIVHMGWTYLQDSSDYLVQGRSYMYNAYEASEGALLGAFRIHDYEQYSGFVNVDITPDNRALVGGHCDAKGPVTNAPQIHYDFAPAEAQFDVYERVTDSVMAYGQSTADECMWPKFFFQIGTDTTLHVVARIDEVASSLAATMYFRKAGYEGSAESEWDYPPYVFDSTATFGYDIAGDKIGNRIGIAWFAGLPYDDPGCDTCSGLSFYDGYMIGYMDNDVYYQISNDQGLTWEPRVNITQCPIGGAALKAYNDLSVLFDTENNLHIVWPACPWPADLCIESGGFCFEDEFYRKAARLLHWSEDLPYIRTIADHTYEPSDSCQPEPQALTVAKPTLSECNGNLYAIWTQFNDVPGGIIDDCALWGYEWGWNEGAANGDIWLAVSGNNGLTWSSQMNLTNTYTPRCDPTTSQDCQSEYWASMSRYGKALQTGEDWSGAYVNDPTGEYTGDLFLDVQYVEDLDAGAGAGGAGHWTYSPIKWFRLPCVEVLPPPSCPFVYPTGYGDPTYTKPGVQIDTSLTI
ncbi:MAG: hypothetical protein JSU74_02830, partial [Candidatus Zixiibacteriota bacterium]